MHITLLCAGKLKHTYLKQALQDYAQRIRRFAAFDIVEVKDEKDAASPALVKQALQKEAARLQSRLPTNAYTVAFDRCGKEMDTVQFSALIYETLFVQSRHLCFLIGGSNGIEDDLKKRCNLTLSFSKLTFPHGLFRVVAAEQIYRALKIIHAQPYHK